MKHIIIFFMWPFLFLGTQQTFSGESSTYHIQGLRLLKDSKPILIKHGLCIDENDCVKKQLVLFKDMTTGVMVSVYGISDIGTISEIIGVCLNEYEKNKKRMSIDVKVYREKHEDVMGLTKPLFVSPFIKLYLQGEE